MKQRINPKTAGEGKSPTLGMNELNAAMEAEGKEVFRFGFVGDSLGRSSLKELCPQVMEGVERL
ncbi:MAG: hypothetical protein VX822_05385 [Candidatus Neomarinimicrobiota bacterium]|nr:hypothetical protein [Candidatus Neomarinimicrobiota bacterium]